MGYLQQTRLMTGVVALLFLAAGCGLTSQQRTAVQSFGTATADFATLTRSEFIQSRQDVIEMNRLRAVLDGDTPQTLDGHFTLERARQRVHALDALSEYGELLQILLTTSSAEEMRSSAGNLAATFNRVEGLHLDARETEALEKAVAFGGSFLVERRRAKAIKDVVALAHPHVMKIVRLVQRDFDPNNDFWNAAYRHTRLELEGAILDASDQIEEDLAAAQVVRSAQLTALENQLRFEKLSQSVLAVAKQLEGAEEDLHDALTSPTINLEDVLEFRAQVRDLQTLIELMRPSPGR